MFNNIALDVFIGLVFVYLLYSLLATILQEILARWFNLRSRMLQKGVRRMLEDDNKYSRYTFVNAIVEVWFAIARFFDPGYRSKSNFTQAFFRYPAIKYLAESGWNSKPAYINASDFSTTLIHLLSGSNYDATIPRINVIKEALFSAKKFQPINAAPAAIDADTLNQLQALFSDANNDIDKFKGLLENWFNGTMDRANGWYKRQSRLMLFLIGFLLACNFNVDSIAIYGLLAKDKTARDNMVQLAIASKPRYDELKKELLDSPLVSTTIKNRDTARSANRDTVVITAISVVPDSTLKATEKTIMTDIDKAGNIAGLGWPDKDSCKVCDSLKVLLAGHAAKDSSLAKHLQAAIKKCDTAFHCSGNPYQKNSTMFAGWLITACAISLGATFWFDMLSKLISLRNAGDKPDDTNKAN